MVTEPASERGQIMLMKGRDLWVFLPNVSQPVRVPLSQRLTGQVANGDLARANFAGDYTPKLLRTERVDGETMHVLELSANDRGVTYHKVMYWVRQSNHWPHRAEFYSVSDRLLKTAHYQNFVKLGGTRAPGAAGDAGRAAGRRGVGHGVRRPQGARPARQDLHQGLSEAAGMRGSQQRGREPLAQDCARRAQVATAPADNSLIPALARPSEKRPVLTYRPQALAVRETLQRFLALIRYPKVLAPVLAKLAPGAETKGYSIHGTTGETVYGDRPLRFRNLTLTEADLPSLDDPVNAPGFKIRISKLKRGRLQAGSLVSERYAGRGYDTPVAKKEPDLYTFIAYDEGQLVGTVGVRLDSAKGLGCRSTLSLGSGRAP